MPFEARVASMGLVASQIMTIKKFWMNTQFKEDDVIRPNTSMKHGTNIWYFLAPEVPNCDSHVEQLVVETW